MRSIARFLTHRFVLLSAVIWSICFAVIYIGIRFELMAELDRRLEDRAEGISILVEVEPDGSLSMDYVEDYIEDFASGGNSYFQIWDAHGDTFIRSGSLDTQDLPRFTSVSETELWKNYPLPNGQPGRIIWTRFTPRFYWDEIGSEQEEPPGIASGSDRVSDLVLTAAVAASRSEVKTVLELLSFWMLGVGFVSMIAIVAFTRGTIRIGLGPLDALGAYASSLDIRQPDTVFPHVGPEELSDITHRLNELLERIRSTFQREQLFSANVFHDLRTPVAELRAVTEVAKRYQNDDAQARDHALDQVHSIALEMDTLLGSLRELLHLQFQSDSAELPSLERVNPIQMVRELLPLYSKHGELDRWILSGPDDLCVVTAKAAYATVLRQLLSNAEAHAPAGSRVELAFRRNPSTNRVSFTICNPSPGLQAADLEHLFDPFWRGSPHRAERSHSGLGLSIARAAAEAIGGSLSGALENGTIHFHFEVSISPL